MVQTFIIGRMPVIQLSGPGLVWAVTRMQSVVGSGSGSADLDCLSPMFGSWLVMVRKLGLLPDCF